MSISQRDAALVLWDVDQTLVNINGFGRVLYERAFTAVLGRPLRGLASMAGKTERAIILETLTMNDVTASPTSLTDFYAALGMAAQGLEERIRESGHALPKAREAISALQGSHVVQSVVTGNLPPVTRMKLEAFGLTDGLDLAVGGYGDDGSDRADLVRRARERAEAKYRTFFPGDRIFVIGDTPHDIKGAHDAGAFAVGVATGSSSVEVLEASGADLVLTDLTCMEALSHTVLGPPETVRSRSVSG